MTLATSFSSTVVAVIQDIFEISWLPVFIELERVVLNVEPVVLLHFVERADFDVICNFTMRMRCFG